AKNFKIFATHMSEESVSLYSLDLTENTAIAFGNEHDGVSAELLKYADGNFLIPMSGMIQSLNVSVACAVTLYEAYRQREAAGKYKEMQLTEGEAEGLYTEWTWK